MVARNIAPGLLRWFAFQYFSHYTTSDFSTLTQEATAKSYPDKKFVIFGSDHDPEMLEKARANAERAWVADTIDFFEHDLLHQLPEPIENNQCTQTVIVTNPPYGKRLAPEWLKDLYRALVKLSSDPDIQLTCITSFPEFSHLLTSRRPRKELKNGQDDVHVRIKPRG